MGLQRVGLLCVTLGLTGVLLTAVLFGVTAAGTEVNCPDEKPNYALSGVDLASFAVKYTDGCNTFILRPLITGGIGLIAGGAAIGLVGVGRECVSTS